MKIKKGGILDNFNKAVKPLKDAMEPLKTYEGEFEKGVPETHEKLDCNIHKTDPQCEHEIFSNSLMIGAGHHVRA